LQEIADKEMPPEMASEWTELAYLQLKAGNVAIFIFALAVMFVFLVLAAQYESWALPLAVILVVPMCLLCSVTGVILAGLHTMHFIAHCTHNQARSVTRNRRAFEPCRPGMIQKRVTLWQSFVLQFMLQIGHPPRASKLLEVLPKLASF
jgi:hypothetical protein